jgi:hypothetical protein
MVRLVEILCAADVRTGGSVRDLPAISDCLKLYGRKVGLLASAFSALTVLQIQQSHFFTFDLFVNLFMFLALWFAVGIVGWNGSDEKQVIVTRKKKRVTRCNACHSSLVTFYLQLVTHFSDLQTSPLPALHRIRLRARHGDVFQDQRRRDGDRFAVRILHPLADL